MNEISSDSTGINVISSDSTGKNGKSSDLTGKSEISSDSTENSEKNVFILEKSEIHETSLNPLVPTGEVHPQKSSEILEILGKNANFSEN